MHLNLLAQSNTISIMLVIFQYFFFSVLVRNRKDTWTSQMDISETSFIFPGRQASNPSLGINKVSPEAIPSFQKLKKDHDPLLQQQVEWNVRQVGTSFIKLPWTLNQLVKYLFLNILLRDLTYLFSIYRSMEKGKEDLWLALGNMLATNSKVCQ